MRNVRNVRNVRKVASIWDLYKVHILGMIILVLLGLLIWALVTRETCSTQPQPEPQPTKKVMLLSEPVMRNVMMIGTLSPSSVSSVSTPSTEQYPWFGRWLIDKGNKDGELRVEMSLQNGLVLTSIQMNGKPTILPASIYTNPTQTSFNLTDSKTKQQTIVTYDAQTDSITVSEVNKAKKQGPYYRV